MKRMTLFRIREHIENDANLIFLDVRADREWRTADAKIKGAQRVPPRYIVDYVAKLPRDAIIITYCSAPSEKLSVQAAQTLRDAGLPHVYPLQGGFNLWRLADYPIEDVSLSQRV